MEAATARDDRGVIEVTGADARELLQRLITNDVAPLAPGDARYAALLTPQGKIIADFIVVAASEQPERFLLDCPAAQAADLTRKFSMYKLRAEVTVSDRSADLGVVMLTERIAPTPSNLLVYPDPRAAMLGVRAIGPHAMLEGLREPAMDWTARRIAAGVPQGGLDFDYGDAFPHEANLDRLNGVDFKKGCYVGQEVVSRMQHRGTARKRVVAVAFGGDPPVPGTAITAGDLPVGTMGSAAGQHGLATIRMDRAAEAIAGGTPILAGTQVLTLSSLG